MVTNAHSLLGYDSEHLACLQGNKDERVRASQFATSSCLQM